MPRNATVVIVEDDFFIAEDNRMTCEACGLDVVDTCYTEEDAVASIIRHVPDVVILDVRLAHHGDGVSVARRVIEEGYSGAVIFATGSHEAANMERMRRFEPRDILIKPFGEREIQAALQGLPHHAQQTSTLADAVIPAKTETWGYARPGAAG